ncbi:Guanine deaminase [Hondaea fermentalgiana]|uniref:Guanine deaminase n=1 Tax=Hondaea fermentalgiana TaxID=2315210 RepID=A0A2R5GNC4_9STRA|nr:Guanine deaminase [Hondaea fermentalgiana]|eukprot:GBG32380.1 Guanine deaminase [Hondaea fermentalgiana]
MAAALAVCGTLVQCERPPYVQRDKDADAQSKDDADAQESWLVIRQAWCVCVDAQGIIIHVGPLAEAGEIVNGAQKVIRLEKHQMLCPGFIDTHIHAPQYSYTGTATDKPLMSWLQDYTFPAEKALQDVEKAAEVYERIVARTLRCGTTTAMYFGTLHNASSQVLADTCFRLGQRALVGKVSMDRNGQQGYQEADTKSALQDAENFVRNLKQSQAGKAGMALPVLTPRFIPTCTPELLRGLGDLARQYDCNVQSHISESLDEVEFSAALHPGEGSDAILFDAAGLLRKGAVMAHGVHMSDADFALLKARGAAIAHCPLSNFFFAHGYLPVAKLLKQGVLMGLGTDVAGGYSPSMFNAMRSAVLASKAGAIQARTAHLDGDHIIDYRHAFFLATLGGAQALDIDDKVGKLQVGMQFDALILDADAPGTNIDVFPRDSIEDVFQKLCTLGDDRNVIRVFTPVLLQAYMQKRAKLETETSKE